MRPHRVSGPTKTNESKIIPKTILNTRSMECSFLGNSFICEASFGCVCLMVGSTLHDDTMFSDGEVVHGLGSDQHQEVHGGFVLRHGKVQLLSLTELNHVI